MPQARTLRSVLAYLKKKSLALAALKPNESIERKQLLSALLLQTAAGETFSRHSQVRIERLYACAQKLAPRAVADALPMPSAEAFAESLKLLPVAPEELRALDPCILGYLYQFFSSPRREQAKQMVQQANKSLRVEDTIAFTQLYTPTAVVDYLLAAALTTKAFPATAGKLPALIDPSCGAGNFLLRAFDLLLPGCIAAGMTVQQAVNALLNDSLHGCDIDGTSLWVTSLAFAQRLQAPELEPELLQTNLRLNLELLIEENDADAQLGALRREWPRKHLLARHYDIVIGNPPYIGRKLLDRRVKQALRELYPDANTDLCAAFIARGVELLEDGGYLGYITQSSLLYLPTYSKFRRALIEHLHIQEVVELGAHVFPLQSGEKVSSMLLQLRNNTAGDTMSVFKDLTSFKEELSQNALTDPDPSYGSVHKLNQKQFLSHRGQAMNYRAPSFMINMSAASSKLAEYAEVRQGLATGNNNRFIKRPWEVPEEQIGKRWFPYVKGAGGERWYSPVENVIDWEDDGAAIKEAVAQAYPYLAGKTAWVVKNERFYFQRGLTFSLVNTRQLAVRVLPAGCIFDVAGSAVFPVNEADEDWLLAYLNSSLVAAHADILNPTINFQVGDLKNLPVIPLSKSSKEQLAKWSRQCVELKKRLCRFCPDNADSPLAPGESRSAVYERRQKSVNEAVMELPMLEREIDALVIEQTAKHFQYSYPERLALENLCRQAAERRRPVMAPFNTVDEFTSLLAGLVNRNRNYTLNSLP
jgi:type I restriction-modification system DNA methylase subunit